MVEDLQLKVAELRAIVNLEKANRKHAPPPARPRLAWIDDVPENNAYEIARLQRDDVHVDLIRSTDEAIRKLVDERRRVDGIISDMHRREAGIDNPEAGLDLIRALRGNGLNVPIIVYTSPESVADARPKVSEAGGNGTTGSQVELFELLHKEGVLHLRWHQGE